MNKEIREGTWSFEAEDGTIYAPVIPKGPACKDCLDLEVDGIVIQRSDLSWNCEEPIIRLERTWVGALPHTAFLVDRIEADRPIKVLSRFTVDNRDNRLQLKVASETKLVLRRDGIGIKFFQVSATSDGELDVQRLSIDEEGDTSRIRYASGSHRTRHTIVYALAMDDTEEVRHWHILPQADRRFYVEPPAKEGGYSLELAEDEELIVRNLANGREYRIGRGDFSSIFIR